MTIFELTSSDTVWKANHEGADIVSCRFCDSGECLALGSFKGNVYIRNTINSRLLFQVKAVTPTSPISAIRWIPNSKTSFICTSASGKISAWDAEKADTLWSFTEPGNEILTLNLSPNHEKFVTGGSDTKLRVYSLDNQTKVSELSSRPYDQMTLTGHQKRIYSAVFKDDRTIVSGGWDGSLLIWDLRTQSVVRDIFGARLSGDALCVFGDNAVTGSATDKDQIQLWDIGKGERINSITISEPDEGSLQVTTLNMSKDKKTIMIGGGGGLKSAAFIRMPDFRITRKTEPLPSNVLCVDMSERHFCVGLQNSSAYVDEFSPA